MTHCQIWKCFCLLRYLWKPPPRLISQNLGNFHNENKHKEVYFRCYRGPLSASQRAPTWNKSAMAANIFELLYDILFQKARSSHGWNWSFASFFLFTQGKSLKPFTITTLGVLLFAVFIYASQKKLYFAGINFRKLKKFWFFASISFRELVIFLIFARIDFRGCRLLIKKKNVILLTLQSTRNLLIWAIRAIKTHILTKWHFLTNH